MRLLHVVPVPMLLLGLWMKLRSGMMLLLVSRAVSGTGIRYHARARVVAHRGRVVDARLVAL